MHSYVAYMYKICKMIDCSSILFTLVNIYVIFLYILNFWIMTPDAERFNGWAAMLGFVAAVGSYVTTGQIIPGIF